MFGFQSRDVYRYAVQFVALAMNRAAVGTSGIGGIPDQLRVVSPSRIDVDEDDPTGCGLIVNVYVYVYVYVYAVRA